MQRTAEITVQKVFAALDLEAVAIAVVLQMENLVFFIESNHDEILLCLEASLSEGDLISGGGSGEGRT